MSRNVWFRRIRPSIICLYLQGIHPKRVSMMTRRNQKKQWSSSSQSRLEVRFCWRHTRSRTGCSKFKFNLIRTEHPKFFSMEFFSGHTFQGKVRTPLEKLDIFAYVDSIFIYVKRHIKTQLTTLYFDITKQKCILRKQVLKNPLSLAIIASDEISLAVMKQTLV